MPRHITTLFLCLCFSVFAQAQGDTSWRWPDSPELKAQALEKQAYYQVQMDTDDYEGALKTLNWLYINNPYLHVSIYQDGVKSIENLLDLEVTTDRKARLEDSLLWMYDQRVAYFKDNSAIDRKAYSAFKLYYKIPDKYPLLAELYSELYKLPYFEISNFNLTPYITLAVYYYKTNPQEMNDERVIEIYDEITSVIDHKIESGGDRTKLKKEQDKVDAMFNTVDLLSCEFIREKMVPRFEDDPVNENLAKKIFAYSLKAKCINESYFIQSATFLYGLQPTFKLAKVIADRYYSMGEFIKAIDYYIVAQDLAESKENKFEMLYSQALAQSQLGNKAKARAVALDALSIKPDGLKAFNLIGNLYFSSFNDCKEGQSKVLDRSIFLAAFDMYEMSGNKEQMEAAKAQFPSIEDIFNEGYEEGQVINVPCWINVPVKVKRR